MMSSPFLNFLCPKLKPKIKCNTVSDDYYVPENLISSDRQKSNLGFMAYHVTKPPIDLDFYLICNIELNCVKIWPQIDSLKSTGFEIFISRTDDDKAIFEKVGSYSNLTESGIIFVRSNDDGADNPWSDNGNFGRSRFFRTTGALRSVRKIRVSIKQTNRCVPVMKRIEIWGRIAASESNDIHNQVLSLSQISMDTNQLTGDDRKSVSPKGNLDDDKDNIPEDFLDTITYEIMTLPMILPSGKVIDNSTLIRHSNQEEKWGRQPSDPFTGLSFNNIRKPILNAALKSQIDQFLLRNNHLKTVGLADRTVATSRKRPISRLIDDEMIKSDMFKTSTNKKRFKNDSSILYSADSKIETKKSSLEEAIDKALNSVRKYTQYTPQEYSQEICKQCENKYSNEFNLYKLKTCNHLICRNCLTAKQVKICSCGLLFDNNDVMKYHKKYIL